jgi:hypothetical protein
MAVLALQVLYLELLQLMLAVVAVEFQTKQPLMGEAVLAVVAMVVVTHLMLFLELPTQVEAVAVRVALMALQTELLVAAVS